MAPSEIKVGCMTYRLLLDADEIKAMSDGADLSANAEWSAFSDHDRLVIGVNPNNPDAVQKRDTVHELLHCCLRLAGVEPNAYAYVVEKAKGKHGGYTVEEFSVAATSGPLLGVMRDNPALMDWLLT